MNNGGKNKSVAFIILVSVQACAQMTVEYLDLNIRIFSIKTLQRKPFFNIHEG